MKKIGKTEINGIIFEHWEFSSEEFTEKLGISTSRRLRRVVTSVGNRNHLTVDSRLGSSIIVTVIAN